MLRKTDKRSLKRYMSHIDKLFEFFNTTEDFPTSEFVDMEGFKSTQVTGNKIGILEKYLLGKYRINRDVFPNVIEYAFHKYDETKHTCESSLEDKIDDQDPEKQELGILGDKTCTMCILTKNLDCLLMCYCLITKNVYSACNDIGARSDLHNLFAELNSHIIGRIPLIILKRFACIICNCSQSIWDKSLFDRIAIDGMKKLLEYESSDISTFASLSLLNKSDEDVNCELCIEFFLENLYVVPEDKTLLGIFTECTPLELIEGLDRLASNEENGRAIVDNNGISVLEKVIDQSYKTLTEKEKIYAARVIWQLAFNEEFRGELMRRPAILQSLRFHANSNELLSGAFSGALFVIDGMDDMDDMDDQEDDSQIEEQQHIFLSCHQENRHEGTEMLTRILKVTRYCVKEYRTTGYMKYNPKHMTNAVKGSAVVVACITSGMKRCPYCRTEMTYAKKLGKVIIPVIVEEDNNHHTQQGWLRDVVGQRTCYDFVTGELFAENLQAFLQELGDRGKLSC